MTTSSRTLPFCPHELEDVLDNVEIVEVFVHKCDTLVIYVKEVELKEVPEPDQKFVEHLINVAYKITIDVYKERIEKFLNDHGLNVQDIRIQQDSRTFGNTTYNRTYITFCIKGVNFDKYEGLSTYVEKDKIVVRVELGKRVSHNTYEEYVLYVHKKFVKWLKKNILKARKITNVLKNTVKQEVVGLIKKQKQITMKRIKNFYELGSVTVEFVYTPETICRIVLRKNGETVKEWIVDVVCGIMTEQDFRKYLYGDLGEVLRSIAKERAKKVVEELMDKIEQQYGVQVNLVEDYGQYKLLYGTDFVVASVRFVKEVEYGDTHEITWYMSEDIIKKNVRMISLKRD